VPLASTAMFLDGAAFSTICFSMAVGSVTEFFARHPTPVANDYLGLVSWFKQSAVSTKIRVAFQYSWGTVSCPAYGDWQIENNHRSIGKKRKETKIFMGTMFCLRVKPNTQWWT
jgi:hypothetical protein